MKKLALLACILALAICTNAQDRSGDAEQNSSPVSSGEQSSPDDSAAQKQEVQGDLPADTDQLAAANTPGCQKDTLANYKKNKVKCTVGDKTFSLFDLVGQKLPFGAQDITVEPLNAANNPGFTFSSGKWQSTKDPIQFFITFKAEGGLGIIGGSLDIPKTDQDKVKGKESRDQVSTLVDGVNGVFTMHVFITGDPKASHYSSRHDDFKERPENTVSVANEITVTRDNSAATNSAQLTQVTVQLKE
jgi:hypothetical protein